MSPSNKITADPSQIEQVILNLVVNARDAMPHGGRISIETKNITLDHKRPCKNRPLETGNYVLLTITDTGIGMTGEVKAHLFEPFFTTKERGKGTGLGLATCYGIIKQSGGDIRVYSEPSHGTAFRIYFPRTCQPVTADVAPPKDVAGSGGSETLLLVEDDIALRKLSALILREHGYRVHEAEDGAQGLHLALDGHISKLDLIITDVVMPCMGGVDMVKSLKLTHPGIKVIFISGYTDDALAECAIAGPGIAFLEKPFSPNLLVQQVRAALDEQPALVETTAR